MPTFETPKPITLDVELGVGDIRIDASERTDTVVEVLPTDPGKSGDVTAAEQTRVDLADDRLVIRGPRGWRQWTPWGGRESIDVRISLPTGSEIQGDTGVAALRCTGELGALGSRPVRATSTSIRPGRSRSAPVRARSASAMPPVISPPRPAPASFASPRSTARP